jgi:hypothetical protein
MASLPDYSVVTLAAARRQGDTAESLPSSGQRNTTLVHHDAFQSIGRGSGSFDSAGFECIAMSLRVVGHLLPYLRFAVAGPARC